MNKLKLGLWVAALIFALDQGHKWYMISVLDIADKSPILLLPFFSLVMVWNPGISFGMFGGLDYSHYIFTGLAVAISGFLVFWLRSVTQTVSATAIGFIIGGALGNAVDRLRFGAVADFLDFHVGMHHWPAFNIADASIFTGAVILCIHSIWFTEEERKPAKKATKKPKKQ
ncbi:MAG: signal peptidase II [Proteobacteria bacterium]|nr:signal peptidase II [Pseudomonadota bacterium]